MTAMTLIETKTLASTGTGTISFVSIPDSFDDLLVKVSARSNTSGSRTNLFLRPNGATTNFTDRRLLGFDLSQVASSTASNITFSVNADTATSNTFSNTEIYIPNYKGSTAKSVSGESASENNSGASYLVMLTAGLWNDTSAITSLDLVLSAGNFMIGTTISLYGILKGSDGIVTTS